MRALFVFLFLVVLFFGCVSPALESLPASTVPRVCIGTACIFVEVADSPEERETGLMFRNFLAADRGMIFVFDEEKINSFWMKNTRIPLDAIWIDGEGSVVDVQTMAPCQSDPCQIYTPPGPAEFVLEVNAGWSASHGIEMGDKVTFENIS